MARVREVQAESLARVAFSDRTPHRPSRSQKPSIRAGLAYEKKFGDFLQAAPRPPDADLLAGPWLEFHDALGPGFAQPDFLLISPRGIYIFECKLTQNTKAWIQLYRLYSPLMRKLLPGVPLKHVQVCRNLRPEPQALEALGRMGLPPAPVISRARELRDHCIWNWRPGP